jgi:hypothetical protein
MRKSLLSLSIAFAMTLPSCKTGQSADGQKTETGKASPTEIKGGRGATNKDSVYKANPQPMREAPKPGKPN